MRSPRRRADQHLKWTHGDKSVGAGFKERAKSDQIRTAFDDCVGNECRDIIGDTGPCQAPLGPLAENPGIEQISGRDE